MEKVIKRNGKIVDYEGLKIENAVYGAFKEVYPNSEEQDSTLIEMAVKVMVEVKFSDVDAVSVEDIQDAVEESLMLLDKDVAKAYIRYRYKREVARSSYDEQVLSLIKGENEYIKSENSNKNSTIVTTQRDYIAGIGSKDISERYILPKDIVDAHKQGIIHFHDMDYFIQPINNCCLSNMDDMLQNGTVMNGKLIERSSRLVKRTTVMTQLITAISSSQYGGQTVNLSALAPFVRESYEKTKEKYDKMPGLTDAQREQYAHEDTLKDIEDAVQTFNYQINSMSTTNGQTPFISVFMNINDKPGYEKEMAALIKEFFVQRIAGMKNREGVPVTQEFPKLLYVLDENNVRPGSEYYDVTELAAKCVAKRMQPDFISAKKMREYKNGDVYGCMGCRSFLSVDRFTEKYGNIANAKNYDGKPKYWGRFNQGVVSINLPDVAFSSGGDMDKFWQLMDERTELCHKALKCRHERLEGTLSDVAPILWQDGAFARLKPGEKIDELLHHGYSTISLGYAGLYECVKYMTGHSHSDHGLGEKFGLEVMEYLNEKCEKWKAEEDIDYSPYGTPIESTTDKFAHSLKNRFGDDIFIKLDGKDRNYITNSYHVPVFEHINPFEKLEIESKFQALSTGGAVSYIEAANLENNIEAVLEVISFMYDHILYAEINTKSDYCMKCGYDKEIKIITDENGKLDWECPQCGNRDHRFMSVARRTCGYIGANFWNQGRTDEINNRFVHLDCHELGETE